MSCVNGLSRRKLSCLSPYKFAFLCILMKTHKGAYPLQISERLHGVSFLIFKKK